MKIISISDLHIEDSLNVLDTEGVYKFCEAIDNEKPDVLVLLGDIGDPWKRPWQLIVLCDPWQRLMALVRMRRRIGLVTIWIIDNHDHNAKPDYLPGAVLMRKYIYKHYEFRHGWEWDWAWRGLGHVPGVAPIAFWLSDHFPQLMIPIYDLIRGKNKTPGQNKEQSKEALWQTASEDWNLQVASIHTRARAYAKKKGRVVILGHTHHPTPFDGMIVNSGDLDDRQYVRITDHAVELIKF